MPNAWRTLSHEDQINQIISDSDRRPQIIFKHSTRCSISSRAYHRLSAMDSGIMDAADFYYLDVIAYRSVSNALAIRFMIRHESPQVMIISNGQVVWHRSHGGIQPDVILETIGSLANEG